MKYLITQEQVTRLQELSDAFELVSIQGLIDELKPIEPLSEVAVYRIVKPAEGIDSVAFLDLLAFARAVEAHILGEKHDS